LSNSLVIAPQWIGDAVMTEPLLRRLHARGEKLAVGALPWVAPVYRAMPQVAEVIEFPFAHGGLQLKARRSIAKQVEGRFDTAYVLPNSLKSALLPFLASIPRRVGYLGEARVGLLTHRLKNPKNKPPMVAFYSALSGEKEGLERDRPKLQITPAKIDAALQPFALQAGGYYVFAPGAEYGPAKRWPARHFAALAKMLAARGDSVWLLGSAKDAPVTAEIQALSGGACVDLAGKTTVNEAIDLLSLASRVVSNDSGLMHVAAALDRPMAALFGSSSPEFTPPLSKKARVITLRLSCSPCFARECPLGHLNCLVQLEPARALEALEGIE